MKKTSTSPEALRKATEALYPCGPSYIINSVKLVKYYDDDAVDMTRQLLGLGVDKTPITTNMLKRVVDTISITYDQPPSRRLLELNAYLPDNDPVVVAYETCLTASGFDAHFRRVDAYRNLVGTVIRRTYASDAQRRLTHRMFLPHQVYRQPSPGYEDDISQDLAVALELNQGLYELWERGEGDAGTWRMFITDAAGEVIREPFGPDGTSPYGLLPIQLIHDQPSEGRAFMPLKVSRIGYQENINRIANNSIEMIEFQAHDQMVYKTQDPEHAANLDTGPGNVNVLNATDSLEAIQRRPMIVETLETITSLRNQWLVDEHIPIDYFNGSSSLQTGAALRAQLWPLKERRDAMVPLVKMEQERAFQIVRAVHNVHAAEWGQLPILESLQLRVQVSDIPIPIDEDKQRDIGFREIAAGLQSTINYLMRKHQIGREAAVDMYEQIQVDNDLYPPMVNPNALVDGPPEALGPGSATISDKGFETQNVPQHANGQ